MIQPQLGFSSYNNHSLFSDHYLQNILRGTPLWRDAQPPATDFLAWLRGLYAKEQNQLADYHEAQLEDNWIKPILTRLGHVWEGQAAKWEWNQQNGILTKPVLTTQKDTFQFSLANQASRQDWHRHKSAVEIFASDKPMTLLFEKPDTDVGEREELTIDEGIFIVPPGIWHEITLEGTAFVFQASLDEGSISNDKEVAF